MGELISAAARLAWFPWANMGGRTAIVYRDRKDAHAELVRVLGRVGPELADAIPPDLMWCIRRVAGASFANRYGPPYYERREAIRELRGALDANAGWLP